MTSQPNTQINLPADFSVEYAEDEQMAAMQQAFAEAQVQLRTIRDFIRFCVSQLRVHDVVVAQGTNDVFAEAAATVLQTLSLDWSADCLL